MKKSHCIDCKKELTGHNNPKRCLSCSNVYNAKKLIKHGFYSKHYRKYKLCCDCKTRVWGNNQRCHSCENKRRFRLGIMNNKGNKNGQFIHGLDKREYPKEFNNKLKSTIFKRDNFICQKCGVYPCNDLTVHHIDYDKLNNKKRNLITLCRKCNSEVNTNRDYWYAYFTYIMEEK